MSNLFRVLSILIWACALLAMLVVAAPQAPSMVRLAGVTNAEALIPGTVDLNPINAVWLVARLILIYCGARALTSILDECAKMAVREQEE